MAAVYVTVPTVAEEESSSGLIEEIIVTSRRRAESQQDIPVSVTAFQLEDIERVAPRTIRDLDGLAPNVFIGINTAGPGNGAIFIRGIGFAGTEKTEASAVGVVIDGLALGSSTGQIIDAFDIEQVEINRGPQGVLFGKNTTGGNIVVERVKPKLGKFGFEGSTQFGNFDQQVFKGRLNLPLGEKAALKIGGIKRDRDGFFRNITRGGDAGAVEYDAYTASVLWKPTDNFNLQFTYDRVENGGDILPQDPRFDGDNPFVNAADLDESQRLVNDQFGLRFSVDTSAGTFTSITGFSDSEDQVDQDFDGSDITNTAIPLVQLHTNRDQQFDVFTQEFRWDGEISDSLTYGFGVFYSETELEFFQGNNQVVQLPAVAFGLPAGAPCEAIPGFTSNVTDASICQLPASFPTQFTGEDTESLGIFGSVNWRPVEKLELSFGLRFIDEDREFADNVFGDAGILDPNEPLRGAIAVNPDLPPSFVLQGDDASFDDIITKFAVNYSISETNNIYFSFAEGFRSGGFSIRGISEGLNTFEPEELNAFELGSKNVFFNGKVLLNVAAFFTQLENQQFASILTNTNPAGGPGTDTIINNSPGDIEILGIDVESTVVFGPHWSLITNFGIQNNDTESFEISSTLVPFPLNASGSGCNAFENPDLVNSPEGCPFIPLGGNDLGRAPDFNWSSTLVYSTQIGGSYFQASVTGKGQDEFVLVGGATSAVQEIEGGYTQVDARASIEIPLGGNSGDLLVSLIGKNLGDREFREQTLPLGANGGFQGWAPPRTYALEVAWRFDPE